MTTFPALSKFTLGSLVTAAALLPAFAHAALYITVVQGLGGQPEYDKEFRETREKIEAASNTMTDEDKVKSFSGPEATREAILAHFAALKGNLGADDRAVLYLVGHGSFDGETYKFNIPGPDLSATDLKELMEGLPGRNHFLVSTGSTSGALLEALVGTEENASNPDYIVIAATRNGNERNATHFGRFFAEALTMGAADVNKNQSVSIQEAFDYAQRSVEGYFEEAGRLATEHAQLRGDGAAQFNLSRLNALQLETELSQADGELRDLLEQRNAVDAEIEELQLRRTELENSQYLQQFQALILRAAELTEQIDALQGSSAPTAGSNGAAPSGNNGAQEDSGEFRLEIPAVEFRVPEPGTGQ